MLHSQNCQKEERTTSLSDFEIINQIASGNERLFSTLFNRHYSSFIRHIKSKNVPNVDSEEICSNAIFKIFKAILEGKYVELATPKAWMYRILDNEFIDWFRRQKSGKNINLVYFDFDIFGLNIIDESTEEADYSKIIDKLNDGLKFLTKTELEYVIFRINGVKYKEIAKHKNISVGTVKSNIHRVVNKLKRLLKQN